MTIQVECESSLSRPMFRFLVRRWPLVVLVIVMAASEEVRLRGMTSNKVWMGELSLRTPQDTRVLCETRRQLWVTKPPYNVFLNLTNVCLSLTATMVMLSLEQWYVLFWLVWGWVEKKKGLGQQNLIHNEGKDARVEDQDPWHLELSIYGKKVHEWGPRTADAPVQCCLDTDLRRRR